MIYEVFLIPRAQRDLDSFRGQLFSKLILVIKGLGHNPRPVGSIKLTADEGFRIRIGDYRVLYRIDEKGKKVFIYRIRHRKEAYR